MYICLKCTQFLKINAGNSNVNPISTKIIPIYSLSVIFRESIGQQEI